jgi:hypothetical protein
MPIAQSALDPGGLNFVQAVTVGEAPAPPVMRTLGVRLASVAAGEVVSAMYPAEFHYNPIGPVHGGVYTRLDLSVRFLAPIRVGIGTVALPWTRHSPGLAHRTRTRPLALPERQAADRRNQRLHDLEPAEPGVTRHRQLPPGRPISPASATFRATHCALNPRGQR